MLPEATFNGGWCGVNSVVDVDKMLQLLCEVLLNLEEEERANVGVPQERLARALLASKVNLRFGGLAELPIQ